MSQRLFRGTLQAGGGGGGGGAPYNGLYGEAPPGRGTFFTLQAYERVGIHESKYMKG